MSRIELSHARLGKMKKDDRVASDAKKIGIEFSGKQWERLSSETPW
jgi:hypothetical protein